MNPSGSSEDFAAIRSIPRVAQGLGRVGGKHAEKNCSEGSPRSIHTGRYGYRVSGIARFRENKGKLSTGSVAGKALRLQTTSTSRNSPRPCCFYQSCRILEEEENAPRTRSSLRGRNGEDERETSCGAVPSFPTIIDQNLIVSEDSADAI